MTIMDSTGNQYETSVALIDRLEIARGVKVVVSEGPNAAAFHPDSGKPLLSQDQRDRLKAGILKGVCIARLSAPIDSDSAQRQLNEKFPRHVNVVLYKPEGFIKSAIRSCFEAPLHQKVFGFAAATMAFEIGLAGIATNPKIPDEGSIYNLAAGIGLAIMIFEAALIFKDVARFMQKHVRISVGRTATQKAAAPESQIVDH